MNCVPGFRLLVIAILLCGCGSSASEQTSAASDSTYQIHYTVTPIPLDNVVDIRMRVKQSAPRLRELRFAMRANLKLSVGHNARIEDGKTVVWNPGPDGGELGWRIQLPLERGKGRFDAMLVADWGIFRAEDIIPRAQTRTLRGSTSRTSLSFSLPRGWTAISEYSSIDSRIEIDIPERRFDQPQGWIAVGNLGVRRETIAGTRLTVAGPLDQGVRRMDMLALLNWTLPELNRLLPDSIARLTILSAGDPMWRGGLSAPSSIFVHADRPLISENGTSTLLHEVMHVAMGISAADGYDWIVEGFAEYYGLRLLADSGTISTRRYKKSLEQLAEWGGTAATLCAPQSTGATTANAVTLLFALDAEIRQISGGKRSLDDVLLEIVAASEKVSLQTFGDAVTELLQTPSKTLNINNLAGCNTGTR